MVAAAHDGRVDTLFTSVGARCWGSWDPEERKVELDGHGDAPSPGSEDLCDLAAIQTFLHGGEVFAVPAEEVPAEGAPLAAIFRW